MNRWYDKDKRLSCLLDSFKTMEDRLRDELCTGIIDLMKEDQASLVDDNVLDFPLEFPNRRWYDNDPYLWLVFNGLSRADTRLLNRVAGYLEKNLAPA